MKKIVITLLMGALMTRVSFAQKSNKGMEMEVKKTVMAFNEAAAHRDLEALNSVLHPDYRVMANRFRGTPGTTLITREAYLGMMKDGKVGGASYESEFRQISVSAHTAMVEISLKGNGTSSMHKYLFLVQNSQNEWQVISDLPLVVD
ncbi:nuclear transport factor 2 family protein [Salmonirosea aquatica]|uniref:DUF4440 domain-containing protein n=1 Tax=Salmonirosea aquatica TaxID=2654236 RepID=A0A7C9BMB2_9BACT|nr:DUF4440 domain-containing protein [Cytophagaceae bacterium SJW1-29]